MPAGRLDGKGATDHGKSDEAEERVQARRAQGGQERGQEENQGPHEKVGPRADCTHWVSYLMGVDTTLEGFSPGRLYLP